MPRIRHWFHVSHDINSDGEVWELTDKFGVAGLRLWLELLSIADRNEGNLPELSDSTVRQLSIKCNSTQTRVRLMLDWSLTRLWLVCDPSPRIRNWLIYNPSREDKKSRRVAPPLPLLSSPDPSPKKIKNIAPHDSKPWPAEDQWLSDFIKAQWFLSHTNGELQDFAWWEDVDKSLGGIDRALIEREFAKMSAWFKENPSRKKTAKGMRQFIRTWLERAKNKPQGGLQYGFRR